MCVELNCAGFSCYLRPNLAKDWEIKGDLDKSSRAMESKKKVGESVRCAVGITPDGLFDSTQVCGSRVKMRSKKKKSPLKDFFYILETRHMR